LLFHCVLASLSLSLSSSRLCTSRNVFNRGREREPSCPEAKLVWYTQSKTPPPTGSPSIAPSCCCCCCRWKALIQHNVGHTLCTALLYSLPTFDDFPFQLFGHPSFYITLLSNRARQAHTHSHTHTHTYNRVLTNRGVCRFVGRSRCRSRSRFSWNSSYVVWGENLDHLPCSCCCRQLTSRNTIAFTSPLLFALRHFLLSTFSLALSFLCCCCVCLFEAKKQQCLAHSSPDGR